MPTRIIRDGILTSERINALSPHAELFYRRLMSVADDHGRFSGNLTLIRSSCYPLKVDSVKEDSIKKHLAECVDAGLIVPYTVDSKPFILLLDFGQRINGKSKFPEPPSGISRVPRDPPGFPGIPSLGEGEGEGVDEDEKNTGTADAGAGQGASRAENCPQAQIIALYHELLPELPPAREWPDSNSAQLRARWRSTPERQSLDWWRKFFGYVHESDFLMGRKTDFQASLGWLVKASNFAKVVNGNYENRGNA